MIATSCIVTRLSSLQSPVRIRPISTGTVYTPGCTVNWPEFLSDCGPLADHENEVPPSVLRCMRVEKCPLESVTRSKLSEAFEPCLTTTCTGRACSGLGCAGRPCH